MKTVRNMLQKTNFYNVLQITITILLQIALRYHVVCLSKLSLLLSSPVLLMIIIVVVVDCRIW